MLAIFCNFCKAAQHIISVKNVAINLLGAMNPESRYSSFFFFKSTVKVLTICYPEIFSHALLQHLPPGFCYHVERPRHDVVAV